MFHFKYYSKCSNLASSACFCLLVALYLIEVGEMSILEGPFQYESEYLFLVSLGTSLIHGSVSADMLSSKLASSHETNSELFCNCCSSSSLREISSGSKFIISSQSGRL